MRMEVSDWCVDVLIDVVGQFHPCTYVQLGVGDGAFIYNGLVPFIHDCHGVDLDPEAGRMMEAGHFYNIPSDEFFAVYDGLAPHVITINGRSDGARNNYETAKKAIRTDGTIAILNTWLNDKGSRYEYQFVEEIEQDPYANAYTYRKFPGITLVQF